MKFLFDLFPVILFFIAFKIYGIYVATAVAIVASIAQVSFVYAKHKKVENIHLITLALIIILGGMTLIFHDETFIMWKPTIVNWGFALVFLGSHFIGKKLIIRRMMENALSLPSRVWRKLSLMWVVFFVLSGFVNIYVAYNYDMDTWVNFKLFGLMGMTLIFILIQGIYISRYMNDDKDADLAEVTDQEIEALASIEMDGVSARDNSKNAVQNKDKNTI